MARIRFSAGARKDLAKFITTSEDGVEAAKQQSDSPKSRVGSALSLRPRQLSWAAPAPNYDPACAAIPTSRTSPFHYVGDVLEVVNIIEGHRDVPALFPRDKQ